MSLVSFALRIATIRVLKGATYAGKRVYDSMIEPANLLTTEAEPFIIVAVDGAEKQPQGRDLLGSERTVELTLDVAVGSRVLVEKQNADDGGPQEVVAIPHTDGGMEITLDFMIRQIERALMTDASPWAKVWRTLAPKIVKMQADRGAAAEKGVRFAARQTVFTLQTMAEPSFGPPVGVWIDVLALMRADDELKDLADILEQEIKSPSLDEWARAMADLGLNSAFSLGGDPLLEPPPQTVTGMTVQVDSGPMQIDAQTADDALGPDPSANT